MAVTQAFRDAIAANDVQMIRIMMKNSLLIDPTFAEFQEMETLAKNVPKLYDNHDGGELRSDSSSWDEDYLNRTMVEVVDNFSKERVNHLKQVVRHLRPVPVSTAPRSKPGSGGKSAYVRQKEEDERNGLKRNENWSHKTKEGGTDYQRQKAEDERNGNIVKIVSGAGLGAAAGAVFGTAISTGDYILAGAVVGGAVVGAVVGGAIAASTLGGN